MYKLNYNLNLSSSTLKAALTTGKFKKEADIQTSYGSIETVRGHHSETDKTTWC